MGRSVRPCNSCCARQHGTASKLSVVSLGRYTGGLSGRAYGLHRSFHGVAAALALARTARNCVRKRQAAVQFLYSDLNSMCLRMTARLSPPPLPRPPPAAGTDTVSRETRHCCALYCSGRLCFKQLFVHSCRRASATTDRSRRQTSITSHDLGIEGKRSTTSRVQPQLPDLGVADGGYRYDAAETVGGRKRARSTPWKVAATGSSASELACACA